ncbi:hypothetical protein JK635_08310 [Neobacillus sp. YIM B02564]|uniref:Uncharacterized protein n=1 Tax=Neobacillus paridis TaxID=2803862 RepID=A0ABS1TPQ5_9BACI|nr:hypothetical protein [Neobacillus paridis]MBL4952211.1 hypothetical protein [Neobacillus paridis]
MDISAEYILRLLLQEGISFSITQSGFVFKDVLEQKRANEILQTNHLPICFPIHTTIVRTIPLGLYQKVHPKSKLYRPVHP